MNNNARTRKRIGSVLILAVAALLTVVHINAAAAQDSQTQDPPDAAPFTDVAEGSRYFTAVKYLKDNGLVEGYSDGSFKPSQEINRAEALKVLELAVKINTPVVSGEQEATANAADAGQPDQPEFSFDDVMTDVWYYPYVREAWENGVVKGYPDGLFHPEQTINTVESLKIVLKQEGKEIPKEVTEQPYNDVDINKWYAPYAQVAKERTLIVESRPGGNLYPASNMNRGDFAELIYHLLQSSDGHLFTRATWYADSLAMQSTANRELYIPTNLTAAHKTLPFGTTVRVTNTSNGKSVDVRINDRGPYSTGVGLDLSKSAFAAIASTGTGIIFVEYEIIGSTDNAAADPNSIEYGF